DDEKLSRLKMRQEREQAHDLHNLRLFQDLGHQSHRARLAAAAVLLDRLRRLHGVQSVEAAEADTAQLIGKVLVAVLKQQTPTVEQPTSDGAAPTLAIAAENDASLRKYIADELVVTLGVRFEPGNGPTGLGTSPLGLARLIHAHSRDSQMWVYKALICMDDLVSRPSRSPDRCELRHVSAIRFPAGCPVRLAGCWRQAGGGRV